MSAFNETTGAQYAGKNVLRLLTAEAEHGYSDAHGWAGFGQWVKAGRVVRKGEHGTPCMTVVTVGGEDSKKATTKPRGFRVFHYDQTVELGADYDTVLGAPSSAAVTEATAREASKARHPSAVAVSIPAEAIIAAAETDNVVSLSAASKARKGFGFRGAK